MSRRLPGGALRLAPLLALLACGGPQRTRSDELVILIEATVEDLDPRYAASGYGIKLSRLVAAPLVSLDTEDMRPRMELAAAVTQPDPVTYDVTLRPTARFSDGRPVTARDVKATLDDVRGDASRSPYRHAFSRIARIDVTGARQVRIVLRAPHAPFLSDLDLGILPADRLARLRPGEKVPDRDLVGAGPLRITARSPYRIELRPNPHYHGTAPALRRYVVKSIEDDNSRLLSLVAGGGDVTQNTVPPVLAGALERSPRLRVVSGRSVMTTYLALNAADPRLRDVRVRRAIAHALDRPRIVKAKFSGRATVAASILPPHHWAFPPGLTPLPHDRAAAERLLDQAGYPRPAGGGPRFALTYKTSANRFRVAVARVIARQLAEVGIQVTVRSYEWGVFFADLKTGSYQLASLQMTELAEPDYHYHYFHSSSRPGPGAPGGGNRFGYASPEVDAWLEAGRRSLDLPSRTAAYHAVQRRLAEDLPIVPLWHEDNLAVIRRNLRGFRILPNARFAPLLEVTKAH